MNFKDMRETAAYRLAPIDHNTYLATANVLSPWRAVPGWTLESNVFDIMHNLFLGTGKPFIASCVRVMLETGVFDRHGLRRASADMFARITLEIHDVFRAHEPLGDSHFPF